MADHSYLSVSSMRSVIWILAASTSLTTTKYLLDRRLHFPMHLLAMQLAITLAIALMRCCLQRPEEHNQHRHTLATATSSLQSTTYLLLYIICMSISFVCGYQAIHHTVNIPALVLIVSPNWRVMGPDVDDLLVMSCQVTWKRVIILARSILALLGLVTLLLFDYRLSNTSVVMTVIAIASMSCAQVLFSIMTAEGRASPSNPVHSLPSPSLVRNASIGTCGLVGSLLATLFWCHFREHAFLRISKSYNPLAYDIPVLAANLASSSLALFWGSHVFMECNGHRSMGNTVDARGTQLAMFKTLAALVSVESIFCEPRLPYLISSWQWLGFGLLAMAFLPMPTSDHAMYTPIEELKPSNDPLLHVENTSERQSLTNKVQHHLLRRTLCGSMMVLSLVPLSWAVLSVHGMSVERTLVSRPVLDTAFQSLKALEIIVSRYEEPVSDIAIQISNMLQLSNVRNLAPTIRIYNKNQDVNDSVVFLADLDQALTVLQPQRPTLIVHTLPNIGREVDTYLEHITSQWDNLANHTIFMQAHPHHEPTMLRLLRDYFVPKTGFLSLYNTHSANKGYCASCSDCYDRDWTEDPTLLHELYGDFNHGAPCGDMLLTYRGQFVASAARLRGNNREVYQKWLDELRDPAGKLHTPPYTTDPFSQKADSMIAPRVGFTLERLWATMLQCNDRRIAQRCPSQLSSVVCPDGLCRRRNVEDCQCLDT